MKGGGRGRPFHKSRAVLEGILCVLKTGARWKDLPERYLPYQTCHWRYQAWVKQEVMKQVLEKLVIHLKEQGKIDLTETFIDATFVKAKKGSCVGKTKRGKGTKIMAITDHTSLPVSGSIASATPHESRLVEQASQERHTKELPCRVIGDKVYDSDALDARVCGSYGIRLVAPHRSNRRRTHDGRALRRHKKTLERGTIFCMVFSLQTSREPA